jgi:hypothetical protein
MPASDQCEPQVIRALQKSGWEVTHQPFALRIDRGRTAYVYADLRLSQIQNQQSLIVVEVNCFGGARTILDELYHAIGQYLVYRQALLMNNIQTPVYLSVPETIYSSTFQSLLIDAVLQDIQIKLIVVDLVNEEVVLWRH